MAAKDTLLIQFLRSDNDIYHHINNSISSFLIVDRLHRKCISYQA